VCGYFVGEMIKKIKEDKFIVKASNGPRYVVNAQANIDTS